MLFSALKQALLDTELTSEQIAELQLLLAGKAPMPTQGPANASAPNGLDAMEQLLIQDVLVVESQSRSAIRILLRTESSTQSASVCPALRSADC